jgi:hypothetical protein
VTVDLDEVYRRRARALLGDLMFEHCRQVASAAPPPTEQQQQAIGRIFGPALSRISSTQRKQTRAA